MLSCIAIDDEELALDLLEDNIRQIPFLQFAGRFTQPLSALQFLQEQKTDLVFIDIQMPGLSGLKLIQSLQNRPMFILITAYDKFALEGFELNVIDYLVKPVPPERFLLACNRAFELHHLRKNSPGSPPENDWFFVPIDYSLVKVNFNELVWIEGLRDYVKLHLENKARPLISRINIKSLEQQLPISRFMRIHKSYIVSKKHITAIRKNSIYLSDMELSVGDNYKQAIADLAGRPAE